LLSATWTLNDLLRAQDIDSTKVLVFRHRPLEPQLKKILPWLAHERPELFNAYQATQGEKVEKAMFGSSFVASFIGVEPGRALFVGLYSIVRSRPLTAEEYRRDPIFIELKKFGMKDPEIERRPVLYFDLLRTAFHESWKGKLIIEWPPPERSWWRRCHKNNMSIVAILEDSALHATMPRWDELAVEWGDFSVLRHPGNPRCCNGEHTLYFRHIGWEGLCRLGLRQ